MSVLCIYLLHPYISPKPQTEKDFSRDRHLRKFTTDPSNAVHLINIDKNFKEEDNEGINKSIYDTENDSEEYYIKYLITKQEPIKITTNRLKLIKPKKTEPFTSLVIIPRY